MRSFPSSSRALASCAVLPLVLLACSGVKTGAPSEGLNPPATTTATPPPGPFNGTITVTLKTNKPATILATTDGTDPHLESASRMSAQDVMTIPLSTTTTIKVYSITPTQAEEAMQTLTYTWAGGPVGTATGVIVVGSVAVNELIGLLVDGQVAQTFPAVSTPGNIPFTITGLTTGMHTVQAAANRTGGTTFEPVLDYFSATVTFPIDLTNPFQASDQNIVLLLGASTDGLCTIEGTIDVPTAAIGQNVSVQALDSSSLSGLTGLGGGTGGGGGGTTTTAGLQSLLTELENGYQVFASGNSMTYPYAITNLQPGSYVVIPILTAANTGGLGLNLLVNPFSPIKCTAGATVTSNYQFGPDNLSGKVTVAGGSSGFGYGMVAARSISVKSGIEAVLMPTVFIGGDSAPYSSSGLLDATSFSERAYTSLDPASSSSGSNPLGTAGGPILSALLWAIDPLSTDPAQVTYTTSGNMTENFTD